ncbi:hypothetical protein [Variovorax sp. PBL-E5]|uniref:hypothetical protein n=1 Tax=Variovorax sp. PBL-E5 TaxID=434014 RepID=UPI0013187052|nr:hypothetical protein [Variovorax sp. PBL-E5]VTU33632.1 hypothetical protein E5CHR_03657 [Variovorax sp. PBL-E5]
MKLGSLLNRLAFMVMSLSTPLLALAAPDLNTTPFHIVNKLNGLCVRMQTGPRVSTYRTATCNDSDILQKFYVRHAVEDKAYIPQVDGSAPFRILAATGYDSSPRQWLNLGSDSAWGSPVWSDLSQTNVPFPPGGARATWRLLRTGGTQTLVNTQFEGMITNVATGMCLGYQGGNPVAFIVVGACGNQDVWRLVPTSYPAP